MRLSEWSAAAPNREAAGTRVLAVAGAVLATLGATPDSDCWVSWGDDPGVRWVLLAPTPAGLVMAHVRVNVPQEGPRAAGKLVRWSRVQLGEIAVEVQGAHRSSAPRWRAWSCAAWMRMLTLSVPSSRCSSRRSTGARCPPGWRLLRPSPPRHDA